MAWPHELDIMSSRINIFPHPPNQSVLYTPTDTASYAAPVSLSIRFLPNSYFLHPPNQSVFSTPTKTASCAAPVSLSVQVLANFSVSLAQL